MASIVKRGRKYLVRWYDPDGTQRTRTVPDAATARRLQTDVEIARALGRRWEPADAHALPALIEVERDEDGRLVASGGGFVDFMQVARGRYAVDTARHYDRALRLFLVHLQSRNAGRRRLTVDLLTRDALETWFGSMVEPVVVPEGERKPVGKGLGTSAARMYVGAVVSAWEWLHDSDKYGDFTPRPRKIEMPAPTFTPAAAPTWAEMDRCIAQAGAWSDDEDLDPRARRAWGWRYRLLVLLRFTGLRESQGMRLRWDDLDLERGTLFLRGELGKSRRERGGREIPLSPHLVAQLAGWGLREGYVIAPHRAMRTSPSRYIAAAWRAAGVSPRIWGAGAGRDQGSPHHAFRKGFKTGLSRLGVAQDVRDYLVGHHRGVDEHYLDTVDQAREAVDLIPDVGAWKAPALRRPSDAG